MEVDKVKKGLENIIEMSSKMRLVESEKAFKLLLRKYDNHKTIDKQLLNDGEYLLKSEFCDKDISYKESYKIFKRILKGVHKKRIVSGKKIDLLADEKGRLDTLENSLGVLFEELKTEKSKKRFMLLLCLGHLIRYEVFAGSDGFLRRKLIDFINIGMNTEKKERDKMIEDFLSIRGKGKDGKADTTHIRNSIAHGRFEFIGDNVIRFVDVDKSGKQTFEKQLNDGDLVGIFNMFEMKLRFMILYSILIHLNADIDLSKKQQGKKLWMNIAGSEKK